MKINEIQILTNDLETTERFYAETLRLEVKDKDGTSISFVAGKSILTFKISDVKDPIYHFAFNIPCNQVKEALNWVTTRAVIIPASEEHVIADFNNWNAEAFYFYDNNGNILEFIARSDLKNNSVEDFSERSILSISEIAIATNNIAEFVDDIKHRFTLFPYAKQPVLDNFAAIGDPEGLFIVSLVGRHWFPTQAIANKFECSVTFEINHQKEVIVFS